MKQVIIIIIIYLFFLSFYKSNNLETFQSKKISVIILNYNRPHNIEKLLSQLKNYKLIDEIIIGHGSPEFYKDFKFINVKNIKDYENNKLYGAGRRCLLAKHAKNNIILFLDDDLLPSEELLNKMYNSVINNYNTNTIFGPYLRNCNKNGYKHLKSEYDTILVGLMMCKKSLILEYVNDKKGWLKYHNWLVKYKGNCEDLAINKFLYEKYRTRGTYIAGNYKSLDYTNGYSSNKNHYLIRDIFCKKYS